MKHCGLTSYFRASSERNGALSIFQVYGPEEGLAKVLDAALGDAHGPRNGRLDCNELRYGWLWSDAGERIDEVLLARPGPNQRVLMTHGGGAVAVSVAGFMEQAEINHLEFKEIEGICTDDVLDPVLAGCLTETQVAAVLSARSGRDADAEGRVEISPILLTTHRLVLAGPPNAGKSSLLNSLSGYDRAFVHAEAGATRDVVDELVDLGGYAVIVGDLPGYANQSAGLDAEAWRRAKTSLQFAEAVLFVVDASQAWDEAVEKAARVVRECLAGQLVAVVLNKADLPRAIVGEPWRAFFPDAPVLSVCSLPGGDAADKLSRMAGWLFEEREGA